jgi:hypothetical protein
MDEKGFMIGVEAKSTRVFSKSLFERGGSNAPIQDGNREWITITPTICGDGTTLPTGIIFRAQNGTIWSNWVMDIPPDEEDVFVTSSPNGWTNIQLGLAWLKLFNKWTKDKARMSWRLLIMDGHSSHISIDFLEYAVQNRIAVVKFPSHSTHSLQPLDVGIFSPLSTAYTSGLRQRQERSQGLLPVKKADFYSLFKQAWASAASESNIKAAFEATGIWPQDRAVVLEKFRTRTPPPKTDPVDVSHLSPANWKRIEQLLELLVKDKGNKQFKKLEGAIHRASTETKLLQHENMGLIASMDTHNKRIDHSRRKLISGSKKQQTDAA